MKSNNVTYIRFNNPLNRHLFNIDAPADRLNTVMQDFPNNRLIAGASQATEWWYRWMDAQCSGESIFGWPGPKQKDPKGPTFEVPGISEARLHILTIPID